MTGAGAERAMVRGEAGPGKFGFSKARRCQTAPPTARPVTGAAKVALDGCNRYTRSAYFA
jgi:hypothetical protein